MTVCGVCSSVVLRVAPRPSVLEEAFLKRQRSRCIQVSTVETCYDVQEFVWIYNASRPTELRVVTLKAGPSSSLVGHATPRPFKHTIGALEVREWRLWLME